MEHKLLEWKNTGLFYCKICKKAEVELSDPCVMSEFEKLMLIFDTQVIAIRFQLMLSRVLNK